MTFFPFSFPALCLRPLVPVCLIFICAFGVAAQTDSTITGYIKDSNGAVLVGVQVTAKHL